MRTNYLISLFFLCFSVLNVISFPVIQNTTSDHLLEDQGKSRPKRGMLAVSFIAGWIAAFFNSWVLVETYNRSLKPIPIHYPPHQDDPYVIEKPSRQRNIQQWKMDHA